MWRVDAHDSDDINNWQLLFMSYWTKNDSMLMIV